MIWDKSYLALNVFIRKNELETIAEYHNWNDIDYSQIKSIFDDLVKMTVGLIDEDNYESEFDTDKDDENFYYLKQCKINFKDECNVCLLSNFKIIYRVHEYRSMDFLTIDSISLQPFFEVLREKYDTRLITLLQGFTFIEFVINKKNADKIEKWKSKNIDEDYYKCAINYYMKNNNLEESTYKDFFKSLIKPTFEIIKERYSNLKLCFKHLGENVSKDENFHTVMFEDINGKGIDMNDSKVEEIHAWFDNGVDDAEVIFKKDGTAIFKDNSEIIFEWKHK